jgi:uncharacterized protein (DUF2267 family)
MEKSREELHWFHRLTKGVLANKKVKSEQAEYELSKKRIKMDKKISVDLEKYVIDTQQWIDEVAVLIKTEKRKDVAWNALRGVLHALRDRLTVEEVFHFSAQLPMLIRGLLFEGYHYGDKPEKYHVEELLKRIDEVLVPTLDIESKHAFKAVLRVLYGHISEGQMKDMYATMPKDIRQLWDESLKTYTV